VSDDLQKLLEQCQGESGRDFLLEAIESFRGERFRQCVISIWIGVVFDIIEKANALSALGQSVAMQFIDEVEAIRLSGDVAKSLEFERCILERATKDFQLLTPIQAEKLEELRNERNRCAHPTMDSISSPYSPSRLDALALMNRAVEYLLSQPPVYGKAALDQVMLVIASDHFPTSVTQARARLTQGPLQRPNTALLRNVIIVLMKNLMLENYTLSEKQRRATALRALREMYPEEFQETTAKEFLQVFRRVRDEHLRNAIFLIATLPHLAAELEEPDLVYLNKFIEFGQTEENDEILEFSARVPQFADSTTAALSNLPDANLRSKLDTGMNCMVFEAAIVKLSRAKHFAEANKTVRTLLIPRAAELDESHVGGFLNVFIQNDQVGGSIEAQKLVDRLIDLEESRPDEAPKCWVALRDELTRKYPGTTEKRFISRIEEDLCIRWLSRRVP